MIITFAVGAAAKKTAAGASGVEIVEQPAVDMMTEVRQRSWWNAFRSCA